MPGPTPEALAKGGDEHGHQTALFCWAAEEFKTFPQLRNMFAVPNGAHLAGGPASAARLKAAGLRNGVPDVMLAYPSGGYHGLFIENKVKRRTPNADQLKWHHNLTAAGYKVVTCHSWIEARTEIIIYLTSR